MIHNHANGHHLRTAIIQPPTSDPRPLVTEAEEFSPAKLAEIWARRAYALAEPPPAETSGQTFDVLVCLLGGERYGLEVSHVREIYPLEHLTPVPRTPAFVVGAFSARGRLISVIDLRAFLGLPTLPFSSLSVNGRGKGGGAENKVVVVATDDLEVGLLADEVADVLTIFKDDLEPALTGQVGSRAEFTQGIAPGMLVVLNLNALLSDKRLIVYEELL